VGLPRLGTNGVVPRFPVGRCGETLVVFLLEGFLNSELREYGYARLRNALSRHRSLGRRMPARIGFRRVAIRDAFSPFSEGFRAGFRRARSPRKFCARWL
jgi:hypothetical protein